MMPLSDARKRANLKYNKKAYDRIELKVKKGERQIIADHAALMGESTNAFINRAIKMQMQLDLSTTNNDQESE